MKTVTIGREINIQWVLTFLRRVEAPVAAGTAEIRIDPATESDEELRHLARWLHAEDELRGKVGVAEAVTVIVTSGTATALVTSLFTWLGRSGESARLSVTVESATGERIDLSCASPADADELLLACRKIL